VVPGDLDRPTGGNRFDRQLTTALTRLGTAVELRPVPGAWPVGSAADRARLGDALGSSRPVLVDGLLASGAPEQVQDAVRGGGRVHVLVHLPLALHSAPEEISAVRNALEGRALHAATGVVATSAWTATDLHWRHELPGVTVALPGAPRAALATGSAPALLRHLAAVSPVKDQLTVVEALAQITDQDWTAELTGALDVDPDYTARVRAAVARHRLSSRVRLTGPLTGAALEAAWSATDVLLLPSPVETWGLVITEALARGIPAVVSRGTGAQEALGRTPDGELPGAVVRAGSASDLAAATRDLLGAGRARARRAALTRREVLPEWRRTALTVQEAMS